MLELPSCSLAGCCLSLNLSAAEQMVSRWEKNLQLSKTISRLKAEPNCYKLANKKPQLSVFEALR
jgi:hypothetical protein